MNNSILKNSLITVLIVTSPGCVSEYFFSRLPVQTTKVQAPTPENQASGETAPRDIPSPNPDLSPLPSSSPAEPSPTTSPVAPSPSPSPTQPSPSPNPVPPSPSPSPTVPSPSPNPVPPSPSPSPAEPSPSPSPSSSPSPIPPVVTCVSNLVSQAGLGLLPNGVMTMVGSSHIKGQLMFFGNNQLIISGASSVIGTILCDKGATLVPQKSLGVGTIPPIQYVDLTEAHTSITATESFAKALTPNITWTAGPQVGSRTVVTLNSIGTQNVINILGDLNTDNEASIILNGGVHDRFIFYIKGNLSLEGKSKIVLNGVVPSNVLFVIEKNLSLINSARGQGTFIVGGDLLFDGTATLSGSIFTHGNINFTGAAGAEIDPSIFCVKN